ncbi:MAG: biotin--[acetyl-CoA-carboxylase] ligase [Chlamydiales bacterium]|nr:biotin--[acetyl-CoA-carboxylase] ligase [Chlamydiales bacterium]
MLSLKKTLHIHFDTIESTQTWAKKHAPTLDPEYITCITASCQTKGRGRHAKKWFSPNGCNLYASLYFTLPQTCPYISHLGQILSLSCITMLEKKGFTLEIKWPNDILISGKKIGGILVETLPLNSSLGVILGIGLNINMPSHLLEKIDQPATSLSQLSSHAWEIEAIFNLLLEQFIKDLNALLKHGFNRFLPKYESLLKYKGEIIQVRNAKELVEGIFHSITPDGRLNLQLPCGKILCISSGELLP